MSKDYYIQWLGVGPGARPPDHYVLLSLPRFVGSQRAIEAAATAQLAKLDPYSIHPDRHRAAAALDIINQVAEARAVLSDPSRRGVYDLELSGRLELQTLPSDDAADMAETVLGETLLTTEPPRLADLAAVEQGTERVAVQAFVEEGDAGLDSLFANQVPMQESDPSFIPRHARRTTIPFGVLMVFVVVGLALVVGTAIFVAAMFSDGSAQAPINLTPSDSHRPAAARQQTHEFIDHFDAPEMGVGYQIRSGWAPEVGIQNGSLQLGSTGDEQVRVDLVARQGKGLFREVKLSATIEPGVRFGVGIASAARLTIERTDRGLIVRAEPGRSLVSTPGSAWPVLPETAKVSIQLNRVDGSVIWRVNGVRLATSPDMAPRGIPALTLTSAGQPGKRVAIESIRVVYDR